MSAILHIYEWKLMARERNNLVANVQEIYSTLKARETACFVVCFFIFILFHTSDAVPRPQAFLLPRRRTDLSSPAPPWGLCSGPAPPPSAARRRPLPGRPTPAWRDQPAPATGPARPECRSPPGRPPWSRRSRRRGLRDRGRDRAPPLPRSSGACKAGSRSPGRPQGPSPPRAAPGRSASAARAGAAPPWRAPEARTDPAEHHAPPAPALAPALAPPPRDRPPIIGGHGCPSNQ